MRILKVLGRAVLTTAVMVGVLIAVVELPMYVAAIGVLVLLVLYERRSAQTRSRLAQISEQLVRLSVLSKTPVSEPLDESKPEAPEPENP